MMSSRQSRLAPPLLVAAVAVSLMGCREEVPLGTWDLDTGSVGSAGSSASTSASNVDTGTNTSSTTGDSSRLPQCLDAGPAGPWNSAGEGQGATETASDWTWPSPVTSMKWDVMIEREVERDSPTAAPSRGYYWAYQFSFLEGISGFLGIQAEGVYQTDPPESPVEVTKIAVFWLSGPPLDAELGDIQYPDARVAQQTAAGVSYQTIHARFDWQACRIYRLTVAPHSTESDGSTWYGAWIEDTQTGVNTLLGRMLLPEDVGALSPFSVSRTLPIEYEEQECDTLAIGSAVFGTPHTQDGAVRAELGANRFVDARCPSSRFTEFDSAVRHELGALP